MLQSPPAPLPVATLQDLAHFRFVLRRFLQFSEQAATEAGLTPQQHQLLLQIAGAVDTAPTIAYLAERLALRHHSTVELSDRCEEAGLILRRRAAHDRRLVTLELTARGEDILHKLSAVHARELHELAPQLIRSLQSIAAPAGGTNPEPSSDTSLPGA